MGRSPVAFPLRRSNAVGTPLGTHLRGAEVAIENTAKPAPVRRKARHFDLEMQWLGENRHSFRGRWVALQGKCLIAVGATAKDVFSKVADQKTPPLVVRVTDEELPFAGW
jgi:hypothetical protein